MKLNISHTRVKQAAGAVLPQVPGLHSLKLSDQDRVTVFPLPLMLISEILSSLTNIGMVQNLKLDLQNSQCAHILQQLTGLSKLQISLVHGDMTDDSLKQLSSLVALQHLNLTDCKEITDSGLRRLSGLINLQHLNLTGCSKIADSSLQQLRGLLALQHLNLACCPG